MDRHQLAFRGPVLAAEIEKTTKELEAMPKYIPNSEFSKKLF